MTAVLLAACTGAGDPESAAATPSLAEHLRYSGQILADNLPADEPGCSAAVGIEGDVVWAAARGVADLATGRPLEPGTTFPIASVTKQFTATAVHLLEQDGLLSLDDPLATWLPPLPAWAAEVTLAQAMHHVSGIPDYVAERATSGVAWTEPRTKADTLAEISAVDQLSFPPGKRFEYSNSNYVLLAEVVRAVTGLPIEQVVTERIFEPLGLDMRFDAGGWSPESTDPSSARGFVWDPTEERWDAGGTRWEPNGDAGIQTTPSELVRWGDNYRTGEVGGAELLDAVLADAGTARYGAGVLELEDGGLGHQGGAPGYRSELAISPDRRVAVAVACNADSPMSTDLEYLASALRREWSS